MLSSSKERQKKTCLLFRSSLLLLLLLYSSSLFRSVLFRCSGLRWTHNAIFTEYMLAQCSRVMCTKDILVFLCCSHCLSWHVIVAVQYCEFSISHLYVCLRAVCRRRKCHCQCVKLHACAIKDKTFTSRKHTKHHHHSATAAAAKSDKCVYGVFVCVWWCSCACVLLLCTLHLDSYSLAVSLPLSFISRSLSLQKKKWITIIVIIIMCI